MEDNNYQLKQQLEEINRKILEDLQATTNKINQKINITKEELKKCVKNKKNYYNAIMKSRKVPKLDLNFAPNQNINYIINLVLFCLANLELIFNICNEEEKKEILIRINNLAPQSFIIYFIQLMEHMRDKKIINPDYTGIHLYLRSPYLTYNYFSQDPSYWINIILQQLELNIDLVKGDDISNIITNNFKMNIITKEKCNNCFFVDKAILKEENFFLDLYLKSPQVDNQKEETLQSVFGSILLNSKEENFNKICQICGNRLSLTKTIENLKNYLILNINRREEKENKMKIIYLKKLKIKDEGTKEEIEYELISVLANIDVNSDNENNRNNYIIYFKNFINNNWFRLDEEFNGDIENEINNQKPNLLIYKKKKKNIQNIPNQ